MANFIGTAGYFQEERAIKRRERAVMIMLATICLFESGIGFLAGRNDWRIMLLAVVLTAPLLWYLNRLFDREIRLARMDEHGASGEREILPYLQKLPDTYTVVCDLDFADSYGNIDQLIIGPTGIFAIDVKNWRGSVSSDGRGDLLHNGRPTGKSNVNAFVRRTMDLKNRITALTHLDPFIQCLFVFPHTFIDAKWGTTGRVLCIHADQLVDIITKPNPTRAAILPADLTRLVAAARALKDTMTVKKTQEPLTQAT